MLSMIDLENSILSDSFQLTQIRNTFCSLIKICMFLIIYDERNMITVTLSMDSYFRNKSHLHQSE